MSEESGNSSDSELSEISSNAQSEGEDVSENEISQEEEAGQEEQQEETHELEDDEQEEDDEEEEDEEEEDEEDDESGGHGGQVTQSRPVVADDDEDDEEDEEDDEEDAEEEEIEEPEEDYNFQDESDFQLEEHEDELGLDDYADEKPKSKLKGRAQSGAVSSALSNQQSVNIKLKIKPGALKKKARLDFSDDEYESDSKNATPVPRSYKKVRKAVKPMDSEEETPIPNIDDEDLLLTDEEIEYDPSRRPDISKMTERQRAKFLETEKEEQFLALPNAPTKRKIISEEEQQLRKAEMTRRRKNMNEKKLEEEKQDTLNKLLKKRAGKARDIQSLDMESSVEKSRRPVLHHPALFKWCSSNDGLLLGIPGNLDLHS